MNCVCAERTPALSLFLVLVCAKLCTRVCFLLVNLLLKNRRLLICSLHLSLVFVESITELLSKVTFQFTTYQHYSTSVSHLSMALLLVDILNFSLGGVFHYHSAESSHHKPSFLQKLRKQPQCDHQYMAAIYRSDKEGDNDLYIHTLKEKCHVSGGKDVVYKFRSTERLQDPEHVTCLPNFPCFQIYGNEVKVVNSCDGNQIKWLQPATQHYYGRVETSKQKSPGPGSLLFMFIAQTVGIRGISKEKTLARFNLGSFCNEYKQFKTNPEIHTGDDEGEYISVGDTNYIQASLGIIPNSIQTVLSEEKCQKFTNGLKIQPHPTVPGQFILVWPMEK